MMDYSYDPKFMIPEVFILRLMNDVYLDEFNSGRYGEYDTKILIAERVSYIKVDSALFIPVIAELLDQTRKKIVAAAIWRRDLAADLKLLEQIAEAIA